MSDYYGYKQIALLLRGEPAVVMGKPGVWHWDDVNAGTAALIDAMEIQRTAKVLDLGCGTGLMGLAAARLATKGWVTLVDVNIAAVACAQQTLTANRVVNADVRLSDGTDADAVYDHILCHLPRGRRAIEALLGDAAAALKTGGSLYLVAHKRSGVRGAIEYAARMLGQATVIRQKRGYHVALVVKEKPQTWEKPQDFQCLEITLDDIKTTFISKPGIFAWDRLDDGTAALIRTMEVQADETVLDLGCGSGLLALAVARRGGRVTAVDADLRAVESTRRTLAANCVTSKVLISDCVQAVSDHRFDVVLCNPPFHQGVGVEYEVAHQMVHDAAMVLRPGGRFYLVSNAFIRYEREMTGCFVEVKELFNDRRYRVLRATRSTCATRPEFLRKNS